MKDLANSDSSSVKLRRIFRHWDNSAEKYPKLLFYVITMCWILFQTASSDFRFSVQKRITYRPDINEQICRVEEMQQQMGVTQPRVVVRSPEGSLAKVPSDSVQTNDSGVDKSKFPVATLEHRIDHPKEFGTLTTRTENICEEPNAGSGHNRHRFCSNMLGKSPFLLGYFEARSFPVQKIGTRNFPS